MTRWLLLDGERVCGAVQATGRVKALGVARSVHGGGIHTSGSRRHALLGSRLGGAITAHEAVERDGELLLRDELYEQEDR